MLMTRYNRFVSDVCLRFGPLALAMALAIGCRSEPSKQSSAGGVQSVRPRAATFVDQKVPTEMVTDRAYTVFVRMRNSGTLPWTSGEDFRLGSINPQDNETWGLRRVDVTSTVAPGEEATFNFTVKSPRTEGEYNFQWRMVQDGVAWFGDETWNIPVTVMRANP